MDRSEIKEKSPKKRKTETLHTQDSDGEEYGCVLFTPLKEDLEIDELEDLNKLKREFTDDMEQKSKEIFAISTLTQNDPED